MTDRIHPDQLVPDDEDDDEPPAPSEAVLEIVDEQWADRYERPRGIFTDTDRRFLWGLKDYEKSARSKRYSAIRDRVEHSLLDLFYLTMLPGEHRGRVVDAIEEEHEAGSLDAAMSSLVEFVHREVDDITVLENIVASGVHNAIYHEREEEDYYGGLSVDVDISVKGGYNLQRLENIARSDRAGSLSPDEVGVLVREGRVDEELLENLDQQTGERALGLFGEQQPDEDDQ